MRRTYLSFAVTAATIFTTLAIPMVSFASQPCPLPKNVKGNANVIVIGGGNLNGNCLPGFDWTKPENPSLPSLPSQPSQPSQPTQPSLPGQGENASAYEEQILNLVNAERAKAGVAPLTLHVGATNAANVRAKEIVNVFSHTRPNGGNFNTALSEQGVTYRGTGENIAYGQRSPEEVMNGWMNSSGHRANILNPNYTSIGVGHYQNASGVDYWVQLFLNN